MEITPEKIKITYILPTLDKGGAERMVVDLILNLDRSIFDPTLILFKRGGEWLTELTANNIPVVILNKRKRIDLLNFFHILSALKKIRPQIIHTHLGGDYYGGWAAKILRIPVTISTEHNINSDEKPWKNILKRISGRIIDEVVAVSNAVKNDIVSRYNIPMEKISVIRNGVNIDKFLKLTKNLPTNKFGKSNQTLVFGTMGRLTPQKGQAILIEAWKSVRPGVNCLIAGTGPLAEVLTEKIKKEGLENKIKLVGSVDAPAFLNSLDAFVFPSLWEGLGLALLEAGLIGLPIIASKISAITEIIDKDTGWLVPSGDPEALAAKINWLADNFNETTVALKTNQLRKKIIADFDIKGMAAKYQATYQKLLKQKIKNYENTTSK
jgi:glycosyltransferase involved in cell wall biosynthesis